VKLRDIEFLDCLDASGARGYFGEGYSYHALVPGLDFTGSTFVAKTTTLEFRVGNMPLKRDLTPRERKPACIVVKPFKGVVLNAVGLSGPGARPLFERGEWQQRSEPFFLSFMPVEKDPGRRLIEVEAFVRLCNRFLPDFRAPVGLQVNLSCPNVGLEAKDFVKESHAVLERLARLEIPLMAKFSVTTSPADVLRIAAHEALDAVCVSNTVPWGKLPERIDWKGLFGSQASPLAKFGGGGMSGKPLLPIVRDWIRDARQLGLEKPINAGGGILRPEDVWTLREAGADSIFLGSIAMLRGWRVRDTIKAAHDCFGKA